jgi:hypothetical protein
MTEIAGAQILEIHPTAVAVSHSLVLPAIAEHKLHQLFEIQSEYVNETDFAEVSIDEAVKFYLKQQARAVVNEWDREINKCTKRHQEFTRTQAEEYLMKTRSGQDLLRRATLAQGVLDEYKG